MRSEGAARAVAAAAVLGTLVVLVLGYRTGQAGGELVYQHGAAGAYTTTPSGSGPPAEREGDD